MLRPAGLSTGSRSDAGGPCDRRCGHRRRALLCGTATDRRSHGAERRGCPRGRWRIPRPKRRRVARLRRTARAVSPMKVEFLYFDGCPSHERLLPRLRELAVAAEPGAEVELRRIEKVEEAEREHFLGSPTVRVDGRDVDPGADERTDFGRQCRLYKTGEGLGALPPDIWIRQALAGGAHEPND